MKWIAIALLLQAHAAWGFGAMPASTEDPFAPMRAVYAAASEEPNKGTYASSATAAACTDTPGWNNGHGFDCAFYAGAGNACAGGIAKPGFAWTLGPTFNNPELNCCACGKVHIHDAYERGLNARSPVNGRADVRCLHGCAEAAPPPPLPPGGGKCSDHMFFCCDDRGECVPQKVVAHTPNAGSATFGTVHYDACEGGANPWDVCNAGFVW